MNKYYLQLFMFLLFTSCYTKSKDFVPEYKPFSIAVIELQVLSNLIDTLSAEARAVPIIPREGYSESDLIEITSNGTYYLSLRVDRPSQTILSINDEIFNIITSPNDTTFVLLKEPGEMMALQFKGRYKEINEYLLAKKKTLGYDDIRIPLNQKLTSRMRYNRILFNTDSLVNNELDFLRKYLIHTRLPDWFVQYEKAEIEYGGAGYKLAIPVANELLGYFNDTLPSHYYDFLTTVEINNEKAVLSFKYYMFLDEYFIRGLANKEFEHLAGYSKASKIWGYTHNNAKNILNGQVKNVYNQYMFSAVAKQLSDSTKIDSLAKEFEIQNLKEFKIFYGINRLSKDRDKERRERAFRNLQAGDKVIDFFASNNIDTLVSIRDFSDKVVYINFWATWCGPCLKNIPELNKTIDDYSSNDNIVFINICLNSGKGPWRKTLVKTKLKGINLFAEENWGKILHSEFDIIGLPSYVLLDKGNRLFEHNTEKAPMIKSKIDKLLKANEIQQ